MLLKTDGRVLRGVIVEEDGQFVVRQRAGEIRIKKFDVEQVFGSMGDVYRYKRSLVPEADPDEHLKLAKWCLAQHLRNEAKDEVSAVLKLTPKAREAVAMLASIEASEAREAKEPRVDRDVIRTGGTMPERRASPANGGAGATFGDRPFGLATSASRTRSRRPSGDLRPPARRGREASRPVRARRASGLASGVARCHNEQFDGSFQLVQIRSKKELSANVFRANLDATLRLVDPANPAQSELLSSALLPHGKAPAKRPIFSGSNDPRFRFSRWVNSLRPDTGTSTAGSRFGSSAPAANASDGSDFAADRNLVPAGAAMSAPRPRTRCHRSTSRRWAARCRRCGTIRTKGFVAETSLPPLANSRSRSPSAAPSPSSTPR